MTTQESVLAPGMFDTDDNVRRFTRVVYDRATLVDELVAVVAGDGGVDLAEGVLAIIRFGLSPFASAATNRDTH